MQDTSDEIYKIQHDIFMKKNLKANIGISEKHLKEKIFREYYSDDFSEDEIKKIIDLF